MEPGSLKIFIRNWNLAWEGSLEALHLLNPLAHRNRRQIQVSEITSNWMTKGALFSWKFLEQSWQHCVATSWKFKDLTQAREKRCIYLWIYCSVLCARSLFIALFRSVFSSLPFLWASTFCCACCWRHLCIINCMQRIWMTWQRKTKSLYSTGKKCHAHTRENNIANIEIHAMCNGKDYKQV